jgi:flagellar biosynthetic protein FlhB
MANDPSKTEKATPKRIQDAREKGNVAKSQEVGKAVSVLGGLVALYFWLAYAGKEIMVIFRQYLTVTPHLELNSATVLSMVTELALSLTIIVLPVLLIIGLMVFISIRWQVGKLWSTKVFEVQWSRFNPVSGLKRMFMSLQTFVRLGKSLLQALCIGIAPVLAILGEYERFPNLYYMDAASVSGYILDLAFRATIYALVPMLLIAAADLVYQRWEYAENLKRTKDEVKDERKQMEGDLLIKGAMRRKMLKMSMQRMMQEVPKADVVITNPTHLAIALRYKAEEAPAPVVVAKGADLVAERIKKVAREHRVPIRENKPLAQALYKATDIGDMIPVELFQATAILLAQIWKAKHPGQHSKPS